MRLARALLSAGAVVLSAGCNSDPPNPFADTTQTVPPSSQAAFFVVSSVYSARPGAPRELYAANADGTGLTRLTFCNAQSPGCDNLEATPSPERARVMVRRVVDGNGDNALNAAVDGEALVFVDLARSVESLVVQPAQRPNGADWAVDADFIAFSAAGAGGLEDLFTMDPNGANVVNRTSTPTIRERRPRLDPGITNLLYERIEAGGKGQIWIYNSQLVQGRVTTGGPGTDALAGTPYFVGSDADPDYSPDGVTIVFRRLTATGNGGLGTWDVMTVARDGTRLTTIATGPVFRGAPDWGRTGILFTETDVATGRSEVVQIQPDGSSRRVLISQGSSFGLGFPKFLQQ